MKEKTETKKTGTELGSLYQLLKIKKIPLPSIFVYVSEDSFEFEIAIEHYKEVLEKSGIVAEILVFVSESGDHGKLFAEVFTPDMFFPNKLIILKNGSSFFKPLLDSKASSEFKDIASAFQKNVPSISSDIHFLIHYDQKDLPAAFHKLFQGEFSLYKPKAIYSKDIKPALNEALEQEGIELEPEAADEFVHKIPPHTGAYIKNLRKLKLFLNKKKFSKSDVENVLFGQSSLNIQNLVEHLIFSRKGEFFKEFTKFEYENSEILSFLSRLLNKLDEIRKFRILRINNRGEVPIPIMVEYLRFYSYSEGRNYHMRNQLIKEASLFTTKSLIQIYEIILSLNIKFKSGLRDEEGRIYFNQRILEIFQILSEPTSS